MIRLKDFLCENYEDYIYMYKENGEHIIDIAVKFIPLWIIREYGDKEICVELDNTAKAKYKIYKVIVKDAPGK